MKMLLMPQMFPVVAKHTKTTTFIAHYTTRFYYRISLVEIALTDILLLYLSLINSTRYRKCQKSAIINKGGACRMNDQSDKSLYCAGRVKLPLSSYTIDMTYIELLDERYVDFTQVHDCCEIYFCLETRLSMNVGGREYELTPGEFLLIMPGMPHNAVYDPAEKKKYLDMMFEWPQIEKHNEHNRPLVSKINKLASQELAVQGSCSVEKINYLIEGMSAEMRDRNSGWLFLFRGYCLEFLILCLREVIEPVTIIPREMESINVAIGITKYMHNNYNKKMTLKDVADVVHISPRHAQRIFKDFFGVSFNKALNLYRMNHAKNYLVKSDLTIEEIAECVGLSSPQPLYKFFREQEKMSIKEYRTMQKARLRSI